MILPIVYVNDDDVFRSFRMIILVISPLTMKWCEENIDEFNFTP